MVVVKLVTLAESKAKPCKPWEFSELPGRMMLDDMLRLLRSTLLPGGLVGVALAAPQAGIYRRFFVVAPPGAKVKWVFNPTLTVTSAKMVEEVEGCLTVPGQKFLVKRPKTVALAAFDENGEAFTWEHCAGLLARIVQHEMDHLEGRCVKDFAQPVTTHALPVHR